MPFLRLVPAALFLISMYYVRREVAKRNAIFYLLGSSIGGFGGILAYGLAQMDGLAGKFSHGTI